MIFADSHIAHFIPPLNTPFKSVLKRFDTLPWRNATVQACFSTLGNSSKKNGRKFEKNGRKFELSQGDFLRRPEKKFYALFKASPRILFLHIQS
ncbi:MAG: hypothetical protein LBU62_05225 [Bacteroidales bacterium]|jgi:hypothetical protein|nr:hypothetical protein [Bacteroidales bacterium]